ncbi:MAG: 50S ribosomal protein L24 [bacterium]|nr:50S ribosomal protein L24 [bacterium]
MAKLHVKKGDQVMVIAGKNKGETGKVLITFPKRNRVIVEGINKIKRATRATQKSQGGIIEREGPIHSSNVMLFCLNCDRPTRIRKVFLEEGKKVRACVRCGEIIDK